MHVNKPRGFTLIELVVGIVVFSIALMLFTSLIVPQAVRSVDPIFQVRATELAQSLINEIVSKPFDENSNRTGGTARCNEDLSVPSDGDTLDISIGEMGDCTASNLLGEDGVAEVGLRGTYNDVDDYHGLDESDGAIRNSLGGFITIGSVNLYQGFQAQVTVFYDDNRNGIDDAIDNGVIVNNNTKLITVTITTPNNEAINFSTYRSNY
jgi:MSHA pilin protein MshD